MTSDPLVVATVDRILSDHAGVADAGGDACWRALVASGVHRLGLPDEHGDSLGTLSDACTSVRLTGRHAAAVPLAETNLLGGWLLVTAGLPLPDGAITVVPATAGDSIHASRAPGGWTINGVAHRVPFAQHADHVVALCETGGDLLVACLPRDTVGVHPGRSLADESRDTVSLGVVPCGTDMAALAPVGLDRTALLRRGAASRSLLIAGALEGVVALTARYAETRIQFGRPIGRHQAVGHLLAELAEESALASVAADMVTLALSNGSDLDVAVSRVVCGAAATRGAVLAHQIHGAIGLTLEYSLQALTRRLWSWRDEWGSQREWTARVARSVSGRAKHAVWELLVQ